jgi:hypothetical protein
MPNVVDYFAYAVRLCASACCAARQAARRRLLRLYRESGCLGTSRGSSRHLLSTSTTPRVRVPRRVAWLVMMFVVNFDYAACLGASARHMARRAARRRLVRLRHMSGCFGTSRGSWRTRHRLLLLRRASWCLSTSLGSASTTSPTPHDWVPRHDTRLVTCLVVNYSVRREFVLRPQWLYFSHVVRRDYLSHGNNGSTSSTPRAATTLSFGRIASTIHLD